MPVKIISYAVLVLGSLACALSPALAAGEACKTGFAPTLCIDVDIHGAATLKGSTFGLASVADSCTAWSKGVERAGKIRMMLPLDLAPVSGTDFSIELVASGYSGPGLYDQSKLSALGAPFGVVIAGAKWGNEDGKPAAFETKADGSGSLTFEGLRAAGSIPDQAPSISGALRWRCLEPAAQ